MSLDRSAFQRRIAEQAHAPSLAEAVDMLKRANRYVGTYSGIRAQELSIQITEAIAAYERQEKQDANAC